MVAGASCTIINSRCLLFFHSFFDHLLQPILLDFGSVLPPKLEPKSSQNRSKSHPRCIQNRILFLITFWIDFWWIFCGFSTSTSTKNQSKMNQKVNPTTQPRYRKTSKFGDRSKCPGALAYRRLVGTARSRIEFLQKASQRANNYTPE